jgi:hypothetical protein
VIEISHYLQRQRRQNILLIQKLINENTITHEISGERFVDKDVVLRTAQLVGISKHKAKEYMELILDES